MPDPIPPRDIDAEQALLGSIMIAPYLVTTQA
jgi:replicative DNA helicase